MFLTYWVTRRQVEMHTHLKKLFSESWRQHQKSYWYTHFQTQSAILGPLRAILDFKGSVVLQAVQCCLQWGSARYAARVVFWLSIWFFSARRSSTFLIAIWMNKTITGNKVRRKNPCSGPELNNTTTIFWWEYKFTRSKEMFTKILGLVTIWHRIYWGKIKSYFPQNQTSCHI